MGISGLPSGMQSVEREEKLEKAQEAVGQLEAEQQEENSEDLQAMQVTEGPAMKFESAIQDIKRQEIKPVVKTEKAKQAEKLTIQDKDIESRAKKFSDEHEELKGKKDLLKALVLKVLSDESNFTDKDKLLRVVGEHFTDEEGKPLGDASLIDKGLTFLEQVFSDAKSTARDPVQRNKLEKALEVIRQAKEELQTTRGREIVAADNISAQVEEAVKLGLGSRTTMRKLYEDITQNPREPAALFLELGDRFTHKQMKSALNYLFHATGADLKSGGPSIEPAKLTQLLTEIRKLQAGLSLMNFFRGRMRLVDFLFHRNQIQKPAELNFETLTKQYVKLLTERYPSADKVLRNAEILGPKELIGRIVLISQYRDAVPNTSVHHFFRSLQHGQEVSKAIIDALDQLEEELEEQTDSRYEEEDIPEEVGPSTQRPERSPPPKPSKPPEEPEVSREASPPPEEKKRPYADVD